MCRTCALCDCIRLVRGGSLTHRARPSISPRLFRWRWVSKRAPEDRKVGCLRTQPGSELPPIARLVFQPPSSRVASSAPHGAMWRQLGQSPTAILCDGPVFPWCARAREREANGVANRQRVVGKPPSALLTRPEGLRQGKWGSGAITCRTRFGSSPPSCSLSPFRLLASLRLRCPPAGCKFSQALPCQQESLPKTLRIQVA